MRLRTYRFSRDSLEYQLTYIILHTQTRVNRKRAPCIVYTCAFTLQVLRVRVCEMHSTHSRRGVETMSDVHMLIFVPRSKRPLRREAAQRTAREGARTGAAEHGELDGTGYVPYFVLPAAC